jgi:hypothetical protein
MWNTNTLWFEVAIVSTAVALGYILLGHFEERTPRIKKLTKFFIALIFVLVVSCYFGRIIALCLFLLTLIPVLYIHLYWLPKRGINGLTGEPKEKYYELRKWDKDIFKKKN